MPCTDSYCSSKSQYTVNVDIRILIHGHCAVIVSLACVADIITLGKDFTINDLDDAWAGHNADYR